MYRKLLGGAPANVAGADVGQAGEAAPAHQPRPNFDVEAGTGVPYVLSGGVQGGSAARGGGARVRRRSTILWFALAIFGIVMMAQLLSFSLHSRMQPRSRRDLGSRNSIRGETISAIREALSLDGKFKRSPSHPIELWKDFIVTLENAVNVARKQPIAVLVESARVVREESEVVLRSVFASPEASLCRAVGWRPDAALRRGEFVLIGQANNLTPGPDEFGAPSPFVSLAVITEMLAHARAFQGRSNKDVVVINMGAKDGKGVLGKNEDPTYQLFKAGYGGAAIEPNDVHRPALIANLAISFGVEPIIVSPTPQNVIDVIRPRTRIDVLRLDLDSYDCDILPVLLEEFHPQVIHVEFNAKFPPPLLVKLRYSPSFNADLRGHVYQCSLSWMTHLIMRPKGYRLVQVDWQSAIYVDKEYTGVFSLPEEGVSDMDAYEKGYLLRESRFIHYWWTVDVEHLLHTASPQALLHQTRVWLMDNYDVCASKVPACVQGSVVIGLDCSSLEKVDFSILSGPGQYAEAALMAMGEESFLGPEAGGGSSYGTKLLASLGLSGGAGPSQGSHAQAGGTGSTSSSTIHEPSEWGRGSSGLALRTGGGGWGSWEDLLAGGPGHSRAGKAGAAIKGVAAAAPGLEKLV